MYKRQVDGIGQVKTWLAEQRIIVLKPPFSLFHDPDTNFMGKASEGFDEWQLYSYKDQVAQERNPDKADEPKKGSDHYMDCVRYLLMDISTGIIRSTGTNVFENQSTDIFTTGGHGLW